jgi:hypothetical protein
VLQLTLMITKILGGPNSLLRIYAFSLLVSAFVLAAIFLGLGPAALLITLVLCGLEITFSFDNAVVNAKILQRMSKFWQQMFMTVGIFIAVFGMRLVLPIVLVAVTASLGVGQVVDLALNDPHEYAEHLHEAHPVIAAFGGMFLLMLFLDFMLDSTKKVHWIAAIEKPFVRIGQLHQISVILSLLAVMATTKLFGGGHEFEVLSAGVLGMITYLVIHALASSFEKQHKAQEAKLDKNAMFRAGFVSFLYLEVLDASFSFDGVIGAFAITNQVAVIAAGLGIGALWVRSMTVHMVRRRVLSKYRYLDHGAHYAIGVLAVILLVGITHEAPEAVTGTLGIGIIIAALTSSWQHNRKQEAATTASEK